MKDESWFQKGSLVLAALRMVSVNHQERWWFSTRQVSLEMRRNAV